MDLVLPPPSQGETAPAASRIALFGNGADVFVCTEDGAIGLLAASRHTLLIDARQWFDVRDIDEMTRSMGVQAKWYTSKMRRPAALWDYLTVALEALQQGHRVAIFCEHGKHRSFQLCLYLLSPWFHGDYETVFGYIHAKRPICQASNLPRLWVRPVSAWSVLK